MNRNNNKSYNKNQKKDEFENKIIGISRVARVVAGGRRFSFRVGIVAGNRKGEVGVGVGKAADTVSAIEKAFRDAKKNAIKVILTKDFSVPYDIESKYGSAKILVKSASKGCGLVAGSAVRTVLDLAGVRNVNAKIISRSKNKINNARATVKALNELNR